MLEKYRSQVYWDLLAEYPELVDASMVPGIRSVGVHASRRGLGSGPEAPKVRVGLASRLSLISGVGKMPAFHSSSVPVASYRLSKGDRVGCSVVLSGREAWSFLDSYREDVVPQIRPYDAWSIRQMDKNGNRTVRLGNPLLFPRCESYEEWYDARALASLSGLSMTIHTNASAGGGSSLRCVSRSVSLRTGLGFEVRG